MSQRGLFSVLLLLMLGCGGYQPVALGACGDGVPLDEGDCTEFVAADRCFTSREAACGCLGCASSQCQVSDGSPAKATCGAN